MRNAGDPAPAPPPWDRLYRRRPELLARKGPRNWSLVNPAHVAALRQKAQEDPQGNWAREADELEFWKDTYTAVRRDTHGSTGQDDAEDWDDANRGRGLTKAQANFLRDLIWRRIQGDQGPWPVAELHKEYRVLDEKLANAAAHGYLVVEDGHVRLLEGEEQADAMAALVDPPLPEGLGRYVHAGHWRSDDAYGDALVADLWDRVQAIHGDLGDVAEELGPNFGWPAVIIRVLDAVFSLDGQIIYEAPTPTEPARR